MSNKRGLGRNLSALLNQSNQVITTKIDDSRVTTLKWSNLQPGSYQPRASMAPEALQELSESIKKQGLIQPIVVRKLVTEKYEIIAGERRWRACQLAQLEDVPVVVRQVDDETALAMALVENLQREDLNAMDQARAMYRLTQEFALTHQQIATLLSKSRAAVSNYLRLLHLHADVRRMLENGDLDMGHARSLLMLDETEQCRVAKIVVDKKLSVRETEVLVARAKDGEQLRALTREIKNVASYQLDTLAKRLQTNVKVKVNQNGTGQLIIHYTDQNRLEQLIEQLGTCVEI